MTPSFDISGKLALVTGSARGLGNVYARGLAAAGCDVVVHGRNPDAVAEQVDDIARTYRVKAHPCVVDVADRDRVAQAIGALIDEVGVPDILVNNAGVQRRAPFHEFPVEQWDEVIGTNLSGVFYVSRAVAPAMVERGSGKIINIGSVVTVLARQTLPPYTAAKGGIAMLTKEMAADLTRYNIQVNAISPGYFRTEMNTALINDPEFDAWVVQRTPARRWGEPEELLGTLVYLASPASDFVTGQNILVDGGMTSVL